MRILDAQALCLVKAGYADVSGVDADEVSVGATEMDDLDAKAETAKVGFLSDFIRTLSQEVSSHFGMITSDVAVTIAVSLVAFCSIGYVANKESGQLISINGKD